MTVLAFLLFGWAGLSVLTVLGLAVLFHGSKLWESGAVPQPVGDAAY